MTENPSKRLVEQRIRNRIIEAVKTFADGDDGVRKVWPTEYFESFFDFVPYGSGKLISNTAFTDLETEKLSELSHLIDRACDETPQIMDAEEFIETGCLPKYSRSRARY